MDIILYLYVKYVKIKDILPKWVYTYHIISLHPSGCKLNSMEAPVARVSGPVRNSRHRDSAPVQPCDQPLGS